MKLKMVSEDFLVFFSLKSSLYYLYQWLVDHFNQFSDCWFHLFSAIYIFQELLRRCGYLQGGRTFVSMDVLMKNVLYEGRFVGKDIL